MNNKHIGIIGVGRFGLAIAKKINNETSDFTLHVSDLFLGKARQAAKLLNCSFDPIDDIFKLCNTIILCVPANEVITLLNKYEPIIAPDALIIDHSTKYSSEYILQYINNDINYRYIGLRPISQANTIQQNYPITFVSECVNNEEFISLSLPYGNTCQVISANEALVNDLNEFITYKTLEAISSIEQYLYYIGMHNKVPIDAVKSIVTGTLEDHPTNSNQYIREIIKKHNITFMT